MHGDQMPIGVVLLDEPGGRLGPVRIAGQIEAIAAVGVRLVFVGDGPEEQVGKGRVSCGDVAQPCRSRWGVQTFTSVKGRR